jgi:hypothetical protein
LSRTRVPLDCGVMIVCIAKALAAQWHKLGLLATAGELGLGLRHHCAANEGAARDGCRLSCFVDEVEVSRQHAASERRNAGEIGCH